MMSECHNPDDESPEIDMNDPTRNYSKQPADETLLYKLERIQLNSHSLLYYTLRVLLANHNTNMKVAVIVLAVALALAVSAIDTTCPDGKFCCLVLLCYNLFRIFIYSVFYLSELIAL